MQPLTLHFKGYDSLLAYTRYDELWFMCLLSTFSDLRIINKRDFSTVEKQFDIFLLRVIGIIINNVQFIWSNKKS